MIETHDGRENRRTNTKCAAELGFMWNIIEKGTTMMYPELINLVKCENVESENSLARAKSKTMNKTTRPDDTGMSFQSFVVVILSYDHT